MHTTDSPIYAGPCKENGLRINYILERGTSSHYVNREVAVQETRWPGTGIINKREYTLYYSGARGRTGQAGTDFLVMGKMQNHVTEFLPLNERACKLRVGNKPLHSNQLLCPNRR
jgi:hypothetical protein